MPDEIKFLSICGLLGYGYPLESLEKGAEAGAAFLGVDAGSTDRDVYGYQQHFPLADMEIQL